MYFTKDKSIWYFVTGKRRKGRQIRIACVHVDSLPYECTSPYLWDRTDIALNIINYFERNRKSYANCVYIYLDDPKPDGSPPASVLRNAIEIKNFVYKFRKSLVDYEYTFTNCCVCSDLCKYGVWESQFSKRVHRIEHMGQHLTPCMRCIYDTE